MTLHWRMFFLILKFPFFVLTLRFEVLQTFVAHHIPSFLGQFASFFCMTMSSVFFLALRFQFLVIFVAHHILSTPFVCGGCYEWNGWHCWSKFFALLRFLFDCHYQVLVNFIIVICFLHHHHHAFGCKLGKFLSFVVCMKNIFAFCHPLGITLRDSLLWCNFLCLFIVVAKHRAIVVIVMVIAIIIIMEMPCYTWRKGKCNQLL